MLYSILYVKQLNSKVGLCDIATRTMNGPFKRQIMIEMNTHDKLCFCRGGNDILNMNVTKRKCAAPKRCRTRLRKCLYLTKMCFNGDLAIPMCVTANPSRTAK